MNSIRVAVAQLGTQLFDVSENAERAVERIVEAADAGCQLIVLPELANVGYISTWSAEFATQYYQSAEALPGPYSTSLTTAATRTHIHVVVGVAERSTTLDGVLYNTALLIKPDGTFAKYRKIHLPREEKRYFTEGDRLEPITTDLCRLGLLVCADNSFPEAARLLALRGAQLLAVPYSAELPPNPLLYPQLAAVRAYENQLFVACANRCGSQGSTIFAGTSAIAAPDGTLLACLSDEPGIAWADLDFGLMISERLRQTRFRDRRPHLYAGLVNE